MGIYCLLLFLLLIYPCIVTPKEVTDDEIRRLTEELLYLDKGSKSISSVKKKNCNNKAQLTETITELKGTDYELKMLLDMTEKKGRLFGARKKTKVMEERFLDALMKTEVMNELNIFLNWTKDFLSSQDLKSTLKEIWFSKCTGMSSGFEHIFIGNKKNHNFSGLHNWIQFWKEERKEKITINGCKKSLSLGGKGDIMEVNFTWDGKTKNGISTIFFGTTPELEMALYTLCFLTRPNKKCSVKLNGKIFYIMTVPSNKCIKTAYAIIQK